MYQRGSLKQTPVFSENTWALSGAGNRTVKELFEDELAVIRKKSTNCLNWFNIFYYLIISENASQYL